EDAEGVEVLQEAEVDNDDEADEDLEEQDELALGDQVRLAGLVDELGDLSHRLVHGKVLELAEDHQPEDEAEHADAEPEREQRAAADAADVHLAEVGNLETGLAAPVLGGPRGRLGENRRRRDDRGQGEDEKRGKDLAIHARESPGFDGQSVTEIVATLRDAPEGVNAKVVELTGFFGRHSFTNVVTVACIALYVASLLLDPRAAASARGPFDAFSPSDGALMALGAAGTYPWRLGHWWTILTGIYLHGGILHILFNVLWIRQLGPA